MELQQFCVEPLMYPIALIHFSVFLPVLPSARACIGVAPLSPSETIWYGHSTLNILWPILIKLGIQLVYGKVSRSLFVFNVIGQRSRSNLHVSAVTALWTLYIEHHLTDFNQTIQTYSISRSSVKGQGHIWTWNISTSTVLWTLHWTSFGRSYPNVVYS